MKKIFLTFSEEESYKMRNYKLTYCGCCLLLFCGIALFLPFSLKYFEIGQISEETCHINHINYPTQLPTHGNTIIGKPVIVEGDV